MLRLEPVDHREQGGARRLRQVHRVVLGDPGRREAGARGLRGRQVGREARHPARRLAQPEPDGHGGGDLDPRPADLAVALREVDVAEREERAGDVHGQEQRRARDEPADVEVAAVLARRHRPQPRGRHGREGGLRQVAGDGAAGGADALLAGALPLHQLVGRRDADHAGVDAGGHRDPRQLSGARVRPVELPADEERLGEEVGEEAEAGDDPVHAEVRGLVPDELDLEHVARLCPLDVHRPGQRVSEPEVEPPAVGVRARARQRPVEPVARLERELVAGGDARHRLEVGVPAVVRGGRGDPHRRPATCSAVREAVAISSSVHRRGAPSWWSERIASSRPSRRTGVTICAARPPYATSIAWNAGSS